MCLLHDASQLLVYRGSFIRAATIDVSPISPFYYPRTTKGAGRCQLLNVGYRERTLSVQSGRGSALRCEGP
jgi:hypothetical protein